MASNKDKYKTQWSGQFYVAAELVKRGYFVGFTMGNADETDIIAKSPENVHFSIEVKSMKKSNFWMFKKRDVKDNLFYIFTLVGEVGDDPEFFVLTSQEAMDEYQKYYDHIVQLRKNKGTNISSGDNRWGASSLAIEKYKGRWEILPN